MKNNGLRESLRTVAVVATVLDFSRCLRWIRCDGGPTWSTAHPCASRSIAERGWFSLLASNPDRLACCRLL